jgi:C4-dicarboxylate-specific signal transduction histidine kinase
LILTAEKSDIKTLKRARQFETVAHVRASLDRALDRLAITSVHPENEASAEFDVPDEVRRQIETKAIEWVAGLILHEIASPIGLVRKTAAREITDYENSKPKRHLDMLQRIFEAVDHLKTATVVPRPSEFDLAKMISDVISAEADGSKSSPTLLGPKPLLVRSDPALLRLALCNGVRNAIEAVADVGSNEAHPIVITWGVTDVDYWISVLDKGQGLAGSSQSAFEVGTTTKPAHTGFGLAIARQAMKTLAGDVSLQPSTTGGARYEMRWPK